MLALSTGFPGGSATDLRLDRGRVRFSAPRGGGPRSMWWHFAVSSDRARTIEVVWERTHEVLGHGGLAAAVPVYHDGAAWKRVNSHSCRYLPEVAEFHFRVPCRRGETQLAYCFPYRLEQVRELMAEAVGTGRATVRTLAHSEHGRPFELLELGGGPLQVWITARHHSGETSGAYVLEGLVREALRTPALLQVATLHVAATMDVDGVAEGLYGKDREPRDFNRDYVSRPCRPEVAALIKATHASGADLFLDLHAPAPGDCTFLVPSNEAFSPREHWARAWEFGRVLEALAPTRCPVRVADLQRSALNWTSENCLQTSNSYFQSSFNALSLCLETSYHRTWEGKLILHSDWIALGRALARAVAVQAKVLPPPDVGAIEPPASLIPRFQRWTCVHVPVEVQVTEKPRLLEITGNCPRSYCWLLHNPPQTRRDTALHYRLRGRVERLTVTAKGYDPKTGRPTGSAVSAEYAALPSRTWQELAVKHRQPHCWLMVRVEGLEGKLEVAVGPRTGRAPAVTTRPS